MQFVLDCSVAISWCLVDLAEAATRCGVELVVVGEEMPETGR